MGLFDFLSKNSSNSATSDDGSQPVTQNPGQTYQQDDRLVQTPFSDVKYPLPDMNQMPQAQNLSDPGTDVMNQQPQFDPNVAQYGNQPMPNQFDMNSTQPVYGTQGEPFNNQLPTVQQDWSQPQVPQQELPPLPDMQNNQQIPAVNDLPDTNNYVQYQPQFGDNNALPQQSELEQMAQGAELPAIPTANEMVDNSMPVLGQTNATPAEAPVNATAEVAQVADILSQPLPEVGTPENTAVPAVELPEITPEVAPVVEDAKNTQEDLSKDTLEIGTQPGAENNPAEEVKAEETPEESEPEKPLDIVAATSEETPKVEEATPAEQPESDKEIIDEVKTEVEDEFKKDNIITPVITPELKVEEPKEEEQTETNKVEVVEEGYTYKVFKNIGFVGLNVNSVDQSMGEKLAELAKLMASSKVNFVLDSGKGYGELLINKLLDYKNINIKGAYLKPFYSDYSDEPKMKLNAENYSTAMFSNYDSKISYLIKSSDVFIMPEGKGIFNAALLLNLMTNANMYFGQHKPIILLGENWGKMMEDLKAALQLTDEDTKLFTICKSAQEVASLLKELDGEYSRKTKVAAHKVLDMRNEGEETDYFVNNF